MAPILGSHGRGWAGRRVVGDARMKWRGSEFETLKMIMVLTGILADTDMLYSCKAPDQHYFCTVLLQPVILQEDETFVR